MGVVKQDDSPEFFRGVNGGGPQLPSPLWDENTFLVAKDITIGSLKIEVGGVIMNDNMTKTGVEKSCNPCRINYSWGIIQV